MPVQPDLFTKPSALPDTPATGPAADLDAVADSNLHPAQSSRPAPIWLQRLSLFVLVMFCLYLGALVLALPWWPRLWDQNPYLMAYPRLSEFLQSGMVRGVVSGIGLLDIWIGLSEAIHYRDYRG